MAVWTVAWENSIPEMEWAVYQEVLHQASSLGIPYAFGGAFATALYTGQLRNTKDFDLYILPRDRDRMADALGRAGLTDHYTVLPYDRSWIYRASRGEIIVDAIWQMANARALVDDEWLRLGPEVSIRGQRLRAIPVEELIWSKLYVLQRERSDWPDVLNLIDAQTSKVNWERLAGRLGADAPLLAAALQLYAWLAPERSHEIPIQVWATLGLRVPEEGGDHRVTEQRASLLESRPWFRVA